MEIEVPIVDTNTKSASTTVPIGRDKKPGWYEHHNEHKALAESSSTNLVLIGDSIIANLQHYGSSWTEYFEPKHALNLGIGGDKTQHILWRIRDLSLPSSITTVIVHCGTNNISKDTPEDVADGIISIGLECQQQKPYVIVIVTGLLPRGLNDTMLRYKINKTNKILRNICRHKYNKNFYFMKQDNDWVQEDRILNKNLYYKDFLHLSENGNAKFSKAIRSILEQIATNTIKYSSSEEENEDVDLKELKRYAIIEKERQFKAQKQKQRELENKQKKMLNKRNKKLFPFDMKSGFIVLVLTVFIYRYTFELFL